MGIRIKRIQLNAKTAALHTAVNLNNEKLKQAQTLIEHLTISLTLHI